MRPDSGYHRKYDPGADPGILKGGGGGGTNNEKLELSEKWAWFTERVWVWEGDMPPPARSADAFDSCTFKMQFKTLYCANMNI